ncbi:hypothetical protein [Streptomyces sp. NPDC090022]|uniref:hypothetical protein n=1 Tax=Streptomyces sp. NPDC090022 TaxID=3365920 RepID=UPI0038016B14
MTIRLAGELVTCYLFSFRLSYSGKAVHRVFASCGQEAFFEGHVHALRTLGGIPRSKVRSDNLKAAVARVLGLSRARVEADRWIAFKSHYRPGFRWRSGRATCHQMVDPVATCSEFWAQLSPSAWRFGRSEDW